MKRKVSFTLLELMIVILIIIILASISIPLYRKAVVNSIEREADTLMELIKQAEKICKLETGSYVTCSNTSDCNAKLKLDISSENWDFQVVKNPWQVKAKYIGTAKDILSEKNEPLP